MRRLILFALAVGVGFFALAARPGKPDAESGKAKVRRVLENYVKALEAEDLEQLSRLFAQDDDLATVNVGTPGIGLGPKSVKAAARSWFDAVADIDVKVKNEVIKVSPAGNAAWVSFTLDGSHSYPNRKDRYHYKGMRVTWGLEKREGNYLIVQGHWSFVLEDRKA
jgi:ketosteroid isomerase-like protein